MIRIVVVEDNKNTRKLMEAVLKAEGYTVLSAADGADALSVLETNRADLIIADIMMPNMDGCEFTKILRENGINTPVLMVTAKTDAYDKKQGFLAGADDYMTKPVDEEEMLLRIKALLRRSQIASQRKIETGAVSLIYDDLTVCRGQEQIVLPKKEFLLLYKLLSSPGVTFTRCQLMDEIWGLDSDTDDKTVNVHINRLRERFQFFDEFEIVTVRGLGYKAVKKV